MKFLLPPAIRAEEAKEAGEPPPEDLQQSQQPNPMDVSKLQGQELANQGKSLDNQKKKLDMAMTVHGATQPQAPQQAQQPAQPQTGVSEQEFQQFAQQIVGAVAQLQQQIQQIASQQPPVSVQYVPQDGLPPQ
jgi:hypothetical protein